MSKFKVGNKVRDLYGMTGTIVRIKRFHFTYPSGEKQTLVKYLVEKDEKNPMQPWSTLDGEELTKIIVKPKKNKKRKKLDVIYRHFVSDDGHSITLCGIAPKDCDILFLGYSVCHEQDAQNDGWGEKLAKSRALNFREYKASMTKHIRREDIQNVLDKVESMLKTSWEDCELWKLSF